LRVVTTRWHLPHTARFPPSPDGGFIEGLVVVTFGARVARFPPSPDGGFIEGARP